MYMLGKVYMLMLFHDIGSWTCRIDKYGIAEKIHGELSLQKEQSCWFELQDFSP